MIGPAELQALQAWIARHLGLHFGEDKEELLREALRQGLLESRQEGLPGYLMALEARPSAALERLVQALTVTETYFFRHGDHFQALADVALPARQRARAAAGERRLSLLSAGCASGEEPYSLAVLLRQQAGLEGWDCRVLGLDFNPEALRKAQAALYGPWSLRDTPEAARDAQFQREGREFRVIPAVRELVRFERCNLAEPQPQFLRPGEHDIIFCRNMLMYFTPAAAAALVARLAASLAPGGFLFLGSAETLRGLSQDFHLCHTHNTFYYQRLDAPPRPWEPERPGTADGPAPAPTWSPDLSWMDAIQRASERIAGLAARSAETAPDAPSTLVPAAAAARPAGLEQAMDLLRRERFDDALAALPSGDRSDADAKLLRAVLLLNLGRLEEARGACSALLKADELNAGAHYLTALSREQAGDLEGAEEEDRMAVYLDPGFAMPWLHLGLLARRGQRPADAARHLEQALSLLGREDSSRVLLFGGGFGREGLIQLCRQGLRSLEPAR